MFVVHLQHLNVEVLAQRSCHLLHHHGKQVYAQAHVAGLHDAGMPRRRLDPGITSLVDARRADHVHDARLGGEFHQRQGRLRHGEVDDTVHMGEQRDGVIGDRHVKPPDSGKFAHVAAHMRRTLRFQPACNFSTRRLVDDARQHPAHAARCPGNC